MAATKFGSAVGIHEVHFLIPLQRQQFVDPAVRPSREFFQGVLEPSGGIETVEHSRPQQALDHRHPLARALGHGELPELIADGNRTDGVFDRVFVDGLVAGVGVTSQRGAAVEGVVEGLGLLALSETTARVSASQAW